MLEKKIYSDGQVDIEAPSPRDFGSEYPAKQRATYRRNSKHGTENALEHRAFMKRNRDDHDIDCTAENAC